MDSYMMNEYSFEYRVFDERGEDASADIKMFPEWCYDGDRPVLKFAVLINQWNIYFMSNPEARQGGENRATPPEDLPLARHLSAVINHLSGAVDFSNTEQGRVITFDAKGYSDAGGKQLLPLSPEEFSGTGKIFFPDANNPEYVFYYTVNMFKKYVLGYTYKVGERTVSFNFDRAPAWDIGLKLMWAEGYVPCLANNDVTQSIQTLKAGSKSVEFSGIVTDNKRFRITFENSTDSQFYLLADKTPVPSGWRMADDNGRTLRCPFCLRPVAITKESKKCQNAGKMVSCAGEQLQLDLREKRGRGRVSCCEESGSLPDKNEANGGYIHTKLRRGIPLVSGASNTVLHRDRDTLKNILLPQNYERGDSIITTVIGGTQSGKSVFISRLVGVESNNSNTRVDSVSCSTTYAQSAMYGFFDGVEYYYPETVNEDGIGHSVDGWVNIFNKLDDDDPEHGRMVDYVMPVYGEVAKRTTDASFLDVLQRMPFIIKLDSNTNMTFFDVPGERLHTENAQYNQVPSVTFSDGLILLVNVDSSDAHKDSDTDNSNNIIVASRLLERIITELHVTETANGNEDLVNDITEHMLAVVLCKLDMFDDKFDVNSAVLSADLCDGKGHYKGSPLQKNTDIASEEVERLLRATPSSGELFKAINRFKYRKFFAVSSLGMSDCIKKVGGRYKVMYTASPKRMEHVLQWLLWQAGIIE